MIKDWPLIEGKLGAQFVNDQLKGVCCGQENVPQQLRILPPTKHHIFWTL